MRPRRVLDNGRDQRGELDEAEEGSDEASVGGCRVESIAGGVVGLGDRKSVV